MFRITRDPSSGSFIQCLAKITIMVLLCVYRTVESACLDCAVHTCTTGKYGAITPTMSISTDTKEPLL